MTEGDGDPRTNRIDRARSTLRRSRLRNVSLASRLSLLVLAVTISSLLVTSAVSLVYGERLANGLLQNRITTLLSLKVDRVQRYFARLERSTMALGESPAILDAVDRFSQAYQTLDAELAGGSHPSQQLTDFYRDDVAPHVEAVLGPGASWSSLLPEEPAAIRLQESYVSGIATAERSLIDDAGDGSQWSQVHAELHPALREIRDRLGADDLYLVDPEAGSIVYSTAKGPDFATNLETGPYSGTTLAAVVRRVRVNPGAGVALTDMTPYLGSGGRPEAFMASPVISDGRLVGVVVLRLSSTPLTEIMTGGSDWSAEGLGTTGEAFLVGADGTLRSDSRVFVEDAPTYFQLADAAGTVDQAGLDAIRETGTTVGFQRAADPAVMSEIGSTPTVTTSYLGQTVYAAYKPLGVAGLDWTVATEIGQAEVATPVVDFRRALVIAVAVFVVALTFATVAWSRGVFAPVRAISEWLRRARKGENWERSSAPGKLLAEFESMGDAIDSMLEASLARHQQISAAAEERLETMRSLLPAGVVDRVEAGEGNVLDDVPQATIVVATLTGIGPMLTTAGIEEGRRRIAEVVRQLDALAADKGLESVKLIGDSYFAGCGLHRPFFDHAPRSVGFAVAAVEAISDTDPDGNLELSVGVASGPVTVGLTGSSRLIYDLWGATVNKAVVLARLAGPHRVLVSEAVGSMLPEDLELREVNASPALEEKVFEVTGGIAVGTVDSG
jgi:class 3 adenylate cyclase